jgi:hypothetical protein
MPQTQYAVFTFQGEEISADWEKLLADWDGDFRIRKVGTYNSSISDERFKGLDRADESVFDV